MSPGRARRGMAIVLGGVLGACGGDKGSETESGATDATFTGATEGPTTGLTAGEAEWRRICDGSQELRLAVRADGNVFIPTTSIAHELGRSYLYVRGDCRYWVASRARPELPARFNADNWQVTRTGVLTPEARAGAVAVAAVRPVAGGGRRLRLARRGCEQLPLFGRRCERPVQP
ncbi:hypothetical protein [Nannocystis pusilla]|uniref:hypothetical protein n=1 Tax=Nannocystis pusilla TaxID=889268 RepID=UPI003DA53C3D